MEFLEKEKKGSLISFFGDSKSGKTALSLFAADSLQRTGILTCVRTEDSLEKITKILSYGKKEEDLKGFFIVTITEDDTFESFKDSVLNSTVVVLDNFDLLKRNLGVKANELISFIEDLLNLGISVVTSFQTPRSSDIFTVDYMNRVVDLSSSSFIIDKDSEGKFYLKACTEYLNFDIVMEQGMVKQITLRKEN